MRTSNSAPSLMEKQVRGLQAELEKVSCTAAPVPTSCVVALAAATAFSCLSTNL